VMVELMGMAFMLGGEKSVPPSTKQTEKVGDTICQLAVYRNGGRWSG
jgi:hypothetical protein